jgi:hypothetical protein
LYYSLILLALACNLYCAVKNVPHILLIQGGHNGTMGMFKFLIDQVDPDPNRRSKFYCKLDYVEMKNGQEDLFPIEYYISYFSETFNEGKSKKSHKMHIDSFYDDMITSPSSLAHPETDFILAATDSNCKYLFSYLNSIKNDQKQIRCIFIHSPTLSENATITKKYKREFIKKLPRAKEFIKKLSYLDLIIPLFYELISKLEGESYDAFKREIIHDVDDIANSGSFCTTPIVITHYGCPIDDDTKSLHEILLNDRVKDIKNPVLLLDSSISGFKVMTNNIISTYYKNEPFTNIMHQKNKETANWKTQPETTKKLQNARWFASKTPWQRFMIRRARDIGLLTLLFGIIFCCSKTIKAVLSFI